MEDVIILNLGFNKIQLLKGKNGYIQMDAGYKWNIKKYLKLLKKNNIKPDEIKLIIVNHVHADHTGGLKKMKEITKAKILVHEEDADYLRKGVSAKIVPISLFAKLAFMSMPESFKIYDPIEPDIVIQDEYSLEDFGVKAKVIHTPGHTAGTISLITESGIAFMGCCAQGLPFKLFPGPPALAQDINLVYSSWQRIIDEGVTETFISHGKKMNVLKMKKILKKRRDAAR
ncbi:MAG: MBL fold metallo-hydrolase [Candidatus Heimdallarchaeota archaeon]|nr:MBL fold metallo-hydrolase [Candidatus Heimdallarchaeota archaeon]